MVRISYVRCSGGPAWRGVQAGPGYRGTRREDAFPMFKSRGRHARQRVWWVGPVFALEAVLLAIGGLRELDGPQVAELAELARS